MVELEALREDNKQLRVKLKGANYKNKMNNNRNRSTGEK